MDFINSYIVLQHIEVELGMSLIQQLMEKLKVGGIASIHLTYGHRLPKWKYLHFRLRSKNSFYNFVYSTLRTGKFQAEPMMQMNNYDPQKVFDLFSKYTKSIHVELTDHGGFLGAIYMLKRTF